MISQSSNESEETPGTHLLSDVIIALFSSVFAVVVVLLIRLVMGIPDLTGNAALGAAIGLSISAVFFIVWNKVKSGSWKVGVRNSRSLILTVPTAGVLIWFVSLVL